MKNNLNIFVDPKTKKTLALNVRKTADDEIISGTLRSGTKTYPIVNGIPRFVEKSLYDGSLILGTERQTAKSFGTKWREQRNQHIGDTLQDIKDWKEQFMAVLGCSSEPRLKNLFKKAKRTLNAGCGVGWSEYLFNYNPETERHCIDISLSVEVAYRKTIRLSNVIVSQASIFNLPYRDNTFDIIYSLGVIHHTPYPQKAFKALVNKLTPGGLLGVYVYNKKLFLREIADMEIRKYTALMSYEKCLEFSRQMTRLGKSLKQIRESVIIDEDIKLLGIKKGSYNLQKFVYDHFIKCWYNPKQDMDYADLVNQDWYHPYYASHHTKEEVAAWFKKSGMKNIKFIQPKGWEHSGYFVSGRKA
ncbi:MAG: hypothetical protein COS99_06955 [Candidatus Omnitrophica bacterium CG07_land_8_20_14_0_80_42_15]|uniref:Methyltransferase type 11 domain-containing protein n=1 Tax=Candidatus Aquitaenariimonas noxiae TaxID=1974741 RepID=A0A2J0KTF7_9BACT|nr:MAG: hypothetical protein COS99_06955 [Candidatus Omnitrophica bacterium CG07_land_8_20_14_0_80_42_15]